MTVPMEYLGMGLEEEARQLLGWKPSLPPRLEAIARIY